MPKLAYLVNQYPQPSQTFIRGEIAALEARGFTVGRYTLRRFDRPLADARDEAERSRTRALLSAGAAALGLALLGAACARPARFGRAAAAALRLARRSERGLVAHAAYLAEACLLRDWLAAEGVEHLHVHFATNSAAVAMLCRLLGGPPYSVTVHGPEEFDAPRELALAEKAAHAAFVVAISDFTRSQLYRWLPLAEWPKVHVVRCGVDASYRPGPAAQPPPRRFVCVGRLAEQKGQLLLVQAVALLRDRGVSCPVALVGDGPMRDEIAGLIARLGLGALVSLEGWRDGDGVRRAILDARALVLPSFAEGLPIVLMEALALGRPVISTYVAGIPELVEPGVCGWLVPAGSVEALAEALAEALDAGPERLARMGAAGAARVARRHDGAAQAGRLAALLAGGGPAPPGEGPHRPPAVARALAADAHWGNGFVPQGAHDVLG